MKKLVYIMDPQCGWCYGNSNNIVALFAHFNTTLDVELMVGGMWLGADAPRGGTSMNTFIEKHSPQMERTTGANVDKAFYELTKNESYVFSSLEPGAAIVWVKQVAPTKSVAFAKEIQKVLFAEGKRLDLAENYAPILAQLGLDFDAFQKEWLSTKNKALAATEFTKAGNLANGFPTLLLQENGKYTKIASGYFRLEDMIKQVEQLIK